MAQTLSNTERMILNAALGKLASENEEDWLDAAKKVVEFGRTLPSGDGVAHTFQRNGGGRSDISGYAPRVGNVDVRDPTPSDYKERTIGVVERIGVYQLQHYRPLCMIYFWEYRRSPVWASTEDCPTQYVVLYDKRSNEPHTMGRACYRESLFLECFDWLWLVIKNVPTILKNWARGIPFQIRTTIWVFEGVEVVYSTRPEYLGRFITFD